MPLGRVGRRRRGDDRQLRRRRTTGLVAATGILLLTALTTEFAHAGTYVIRNCSVPGYANAPMGPWRTLASDNIAVDDACANGGGVRFNAVGTRELPPDAAATLALQRPLAGPRSEIELVSVSLWFDARLGGSGQGLRLIAGDHEPDGEDRSWELTGPPGSESLSAQNVLRPGKTALFLVALVCGPLHPPRPP
jgi:hypothetical protein